MKVAKFALMRDPAFVLILRRLDFPTNDTRESLKDHILNDFEHGKAHFEFITAALVHL